MANRFQQFFKSVAERIRRVFRRKPKEKEIVGPPKPEVIPEEPSILPDEPLQPTEPEPAPELGEERPKEPKYVEAIITLHGDSPGDKSKNKSPIDFEATIRVVATPKSLEGLMREIIGLIHERIPVTIGKDSRQVPIPDADHAQVISSDFTFRGRSKTGGHVERSNRLAAEAVRAKAQQYLDREGNKE